MKRLRFALIVLSAIGGPVTAWGQSNGASPSIAAPFGSPVDDQRVFVHGLLEQFEYRAAGHDSVSRWEGEAWVGTDTHRVWIKSEGVVGRHGDVRDGDHEVLYDRPVSTYFDVQAGLRIDLDAAPGRAWAAFGIEGLAPYFLHVSATGYASDGGHFAAKVQLFYDQLLTQRLILQPQFEINVYTKVDPRRQVGSGLSNIDAGIRLRYEVNRKFAPYVGVSYQRAFTSTAQYVRAESGRAGNASVLVGIRGWF